ncbi:hypothetical protein [Haladaptatus sp. DYF46]|uniref:hypothetical protein n=1 Tax=Haladaptatus sp. DYF46 TaxID=2886041 RepID=UPI001E354B6E|nr:hypothetical protein [Haladaptatus sp. DYF46]
MSDNDSPQEKRTAKRTLIDDCPYCDEPVSMITVKDPEYMYLWPCGHRMPI